MLAVHLAASTILPIVWLVERTRPRPDSSTGAEPVVLPLRPFLDNQSFGTLLSLAGGRQHADEQEPGP